ESSLMVSFSVVEGLQEELYQRLLAGNAGAVWKQLYSCYLSGMELAVLYDEVVAPTLRRIGEQWSCGQLSVAHEHLASNTLLEALQAFRHLTRLETLYPRRAVCAAVEPEEHVFGLLMAAHVLESSGYRVDFLGARTPAADLAEWVSAYRPHVLCVGFVMPLPAEHVRELLWTLRQRALQSDTRVFAGGQASDPAWAAEGLVDGVYSTFRGLKGAVVAV
ncbi:MAG: cobalamin-dependent protein, partial [Candidatus Kapabacteria bacterium]|nr:cobalamin-dependent protein [Candidatus Kapabacteria bacterium]